MGEPVKLFLDEHIWVDLAETLRQQGYDAVYILDTGQRGLDDAASYSAFGR